MVDPNVRGDLQEAPIMAKDPAFLFYPNDFETKTKFMSHEQVGMYLRLLITQHQHGHMTEKQILFICGRLDPDVMAKFDVDDSGLYYNKRLENEMHRRKAFAESRRQNRMSKTSTTSVLHKETETENINIVFAKPHIMQIRNYLKMHNHPDFADKFYNYYEANGWVMGNKPMQNWRAACNMWASRERTEPSTRTIQKADLTDWKNDDT